MKPEFSELLIPANKLQGATSSEPSIRLIGREKATSMSKCFITAAIVFGFILAIVTTAFIVRYEDKLVVYQEKFSNYEERINSLEHRLNNIHKSWEEEYGPIVASEQDFEYDIPNHSSSDLSSDEYLSREDDDEEDGVKLHSDNELRGVS